MFSSKLLDRPIQHDYLALVENRLSLSDRSNSISKTGPSSLLPPAPGRSFFRRKAAPLPKLSPSSLLPPSQEKTDRDRALEQAVAISPGSLLPPEAERPPEKLPEHGPSSLLPEAPDETKVDSGAAHLVAVSPSSLLPHEARPLFKPQDPLPQQSPSSLLPEGPIRASRSQMLEEAVTVSPSELVPNSGPESYRSLTREELVAVSPTELLVPRPATRLPSWINRWTIGAACMVVLFAAFVVFRAHLKSVPELMDEAVDYANRHNFDVAVIRLNAVLARETNHAEARFLLGRSQLALGKPDLAEVELRLAVSAGWPKNEVATEIARAMLRQGKFQALLDEALPDATGDASAAGAIHALRGLAHFALGAENEARAAFEKALSHSPDNADALLGLARIAERGKRFDEADRLIEKALRTGGARNADGWLLKGELRWR